MARLAGELLHPAARVFRFSLLVWPFFRGRPVSGASVRVGSKDGECSPASPPAFPEGPRLPRLRALGAPADSLTAAAAAAAAAGLWWALGCRAKQCGREGRQHARGPGSTCRREGWPQPAACQERPPSEKSPVTLSRSGTPGVRMASLGESPGLRGPVLVQEGRFLLTTGYACTWVCFFFSSPASPLNHWQKVKYLSVPVVGAGEK